MADKKTTWNVWESPYGTLHLPLDDRLDKVNKFAEDEWKTGRRTVFDPRKPSDTVHQRDEPDDTNAYARGGMVKHGSSTRVSCKSKVK